MSRVPPETPPFADEIFPDENGQFLDEDGQPIPVFDMAAVPTDEAIAHLVEVYGTPEGEARFMVAMAKGEIDGDCYAVDEHGRRLSAAESMRRTNERRRAVDTVDTVDTAEAHAAG